MSSYASLIAARSRLTLADVLHIVETAPNRYKVYPIPKKNGGERLIAHPAKELKLVQRALVELLRQSLPVHSASTAYESGSSIFDNAKQHAGKDWLVKLDIRNFFNSIHPEDLDSLLVEREIDEDLRIICQKALFWKPRHANRTCLSVGAPSSPFIANRLMFRFDEALSAFCKERGIEYTRYADDLAFSKNSEMDLAEVSQFTVLELAKVGNFALNENKCRQIGPGARKQVTGLILANDGRVTLGRTRRRRIEAQLCNYLAGSQDDPEKIRGHLAFLKMADRLAYDRLKSRFGDHDLSKKSCFFS